MIIEWLIGLASGLVDFFFGLFPTWDPPAFLVGLDTMLNDLFASVGGLAAWADWPYIIGITTAVVVTWLATFAGKILRAVAAHIPGFGGAG